MESELLSSVSLGSATNSTTQANSFGSVSGLFHNLLLDESCFDEIRAKYLLTRHGCNDADLLACIERGGRAAFIAYTRWLMDHYREQKFTRLRLRLCVSDASQCKDGIKNLIHWAATRGAEELDLDFANVACYPRHPDDYTGFAELPYDFYLLNDKLPHTLRLSGCNFDPAGFFMLTELRKLSIEKVQVDPYIFKHLEAFCYHLEDLTLKMVDVPGDLHIVDRWRMLKRVTIEGCLSGPTGTASIRIEAPCLKYFKYSGFVVPIIVNGGLSLEEAELDFNLEYTFYRHGNLLSDILFHLQNASVLTVCSYVTRVIPFGLEILHRPVVMIIQLRHLVLKNTMLHVNESAGIVFLLNCFPMLETLAIEMGYREQLTAIWLADQEYCRPSLNVKTFWESQPSPICLERHLKKVCIKNFRGQENEVHFLLFLLKKSKRMEELSVAIANEMKQDLENYDTYSLAARQLEQCDTGSLGLKIHICLEKKDGDTPNI